MTITLEQLQGWMDGREDEHIEFKEAKRQYDLTKLVSYCVALANENGGKLILGVTDKRPRQVVGSQAFLDIGKTKRTLLDKLRLRVDIEVVQHPAGRVLVLVVPPRPVGYPLQNDGVYWMRSGESLVPMPPDHLQRIFTETGPDFSTETCPRATIADLDRAAMDWFRERWAQKSVTRHS